jgi:DNA-binding NarL/FixJ family response regulator
LVTPIFTVIVFQATMNTGHLSDGFRKNIHYRRGGCMLNTIKYMNQLTKREIEVLGYLAWGWNNRRIADKLCITIRTVKFHTAHIYEKIEVDSRPAAVAYAWKNYEFSEPQEN